MSAGSAVFCYDANGNMTQKIAGSTTSYTYDAENRMTAVSGAATATFVYDGDGNRVKGVVGGVTTTYIGNYFEWSGSTSMMKKYYYAGGTRVAERKGTTLYWLLSDHLGSTSITATSSGSKTAELRYKAWGETRYTYGTTQTTFRFTGQREESSLGLYWYASRWYSATLGRFVSPDSIIPQPGNPQAWDRYGYTYSNPVRYTDPSGHKACSNGGEGSDSCGPDQYENLKFRYRLFKTYIWKPLPEINDIKTGVNFPEKPDGIEWETWTVMVKNRTSEFYEKYREQLFLSGYTMFISEDGMIKDQALISLVISGEFGIYKLTNSQSFTDHLGALSKQYANNSYETYGTAICEGGCPSIKSQLEWLQAFEAIRNKKALAVAFGPNLLPSDLRPRWSTFLVDATTVMGPPFGSYDSWGVGEDGNEILR